MRLLAAAALAALALAGCAAGDDPAPPNADPNGPPPSFPPTRDDGTTGPATGTPAPGTTVSASPSNTSTGTATATSTAGPRAGFPPHDEEASASDPEFSGLAVNGRLSGSGALVRVEAAANKFSPAAYRVPDGQCAQPWTEAMAGPDGAPVHRLRPVATCAAFGLRDMEDNEAISSALAWNGTLWDEAAGRYVAAPPGTYTWQVTFHVYSGGSGAQYDDHAALALSFQVRVP